MRILCLILLWVASGLSPPAAAQTTRAGAPPESPQGFALEPNYANPAAPGTSIPFYLEAVLFERTDTVVVSMRIYNVLRELVAVPYTVGPNARQRPPLLAMRFTSPGRKVAYWDGKDERTGRRVASGVYYAELVVNDQRQIGKLVVLTPERRRPSIFPWFGRRQENRPP